MSQGIERGAQESSEEDQGALERFVRESFAEAEPPMVGAFAALLLSDAIELRTFDLLGEKAFEAPPLVGGGIETRELREERLIELVSSTLAVNVANLCAYAQTGDVPMVWAPGWWTELPDELAAIRQTIAILLHSLFVPALGPRDGYREGYWYDPGPIDPTNPSWELVAMLHIARERLLAHAGRAAATLPIEAETAPGTWPC
ncbi:MAG: hypothetical protein R3B82_04270 [Sandaracinaceae bacterium]